MANHKQISVLVKPHPTALSWIWREIVLNKSLQCMTHLYFLTRYAYEWFFKESRNHSLRMNITITKDFIDIINLLPNKKTCNIFKYRYFSVAQSIIYGILMSFLVQLFNGINFYHINLVPPEQGFKFRLISWILCPYNYSSKSIWVYNKEPESTKKQVDCY